MLPGRRAPRSRLSAADERRLSGTGRPYQGPATCPGLTVIGDAAVGPWSLGSCMVLDEWVGGWPEFEHAPVAVAAGVAFVVCADGGGPFRAGFSHPSAAGYLRIEAANGGISGPQVFPGKFALGLSVDLGCGSRWAPSSLKGGRDVLGASRGGEEFLLG